MAFSFRFGTKWCHDFPKLARESGFYFNMHKSRVRVDWYRISNIDIDQIIRDRDFCVIDDNINSVIDYCLEREYDVKILDPNFVKLFRLAQLAVEYLLYCKEYLDHSVIILKDELRLKIEENVKLKKEITTLEEVVKHLKEKAKDRSKLIETKIGGGSGEIFKCPHCPKTFMSSMFVSAHVLRRHAYVSDLCMSSSPIHDHHHSETEKLHNEIKTLKERLNETERVLRNESEKVPEKKAQVYDRRLSENEVENFKCDINKLEENQGYKGYQEEIRSLKTMLLDEIHNLRQKEKMLSERTSEINVQILMNQQEKEFQKLRNQLFERLTPDIENMQANLYAQENYWKSKIEQLENQHHKDIEKLTTELKQTQKAANDMKANYESKVNDLERQTASQSNMLMEQSKHLHSLSHEISVSQLHEKYKNSERLPRNNQSVMLVQSTEILKEPGKSDQNQKDYVDATIEPVIMGNVDNTFSSHLSNNIFPATLQHKFVRSVHTLKPANKVVTDEAETSIKQTDTKTKNEKFENKKDMGEDLKDSSSSNVTESEDSVPERGTNYEIRHAKHDSHNQLIVRSELNESDTNKVDDRNVYNKHLSSVKNSKQSEVLKGDSSSETNSESVSSDSCTHSESESLTVIGNNSPITEHKTYPSLHIKPKKTIQRNLSHKRLRTNLIDAFEQKLRDVGIDPEWQGIPKVTFKQKMDILKHHQKITMRTLPTYHETKLKIIDEVLKELSREGKVLKNFKQIKQMSSNNLESETKSMPRKAFSDMKNSGNNTSTLQTRDETHYKLYSPEIKSTSKDINKTGSSFVRSRKIPNYKDIESLIKLSPNSVKSLENIQQSRNSLSKMKTLLDPEWHEMTSDSKNQENENAANLEMEPESQNISISPKQSKSVLKSANGSTSSLVKKKVIFDLADERDEGTLLNYNSKKEELNERVWNISRNKNINVSISSTFDEKKHLSESEHYKNTSNIILKTAQSDKIAEISRKLEEQLSMVRQKPVGSVQTIFAPKYVQEKQSENNDNQQMSSRSISSLSEGPVKASTLSCKLSNDLSPQAAPRNLKDKISETLHVESISEVSDLESEIDRILKLK
ncbi:PREDICTED: zinc finger protein Dzip1 [Dufourea novaeangliae]|uniref:zinc finger protein Dzip1 n=1 Tax=Dufourea novaeangliae TaxID=178035 RepID=UPI0007670F13|nr:PREDICTED: zinc finger protein Dzip1 [Dufourea novaeangliae]